VGITRTGDPAPARARAGRVLAGHRAAIAHELARRGEAGQAADLGHDGGGAELGDSAQGLQGSDRRLEGWGGRRRGLIDRALQAAEALALGRAASGQGQVVAIVGEPGVGKSRLVWEVTHWSGGQAGVE